MKKITILITLITLIPLFADSFSLKNLDSFKKGYKVLPSATPRTIQGISYKTYLKTASTTPASALGIGILNEDTIYSYQEWTYADNTGTKTRHDILYIFKNAKAENGALGRFGMTASLPAVPTVATADVSFSIGSATQDSILTGTILEVPLTGVSIDVELSLKIGKATDGRLFYSHSKKEFTIKKATITEPATTE